IAPRRIGGNPIAEGSAQHLPHRQASGLAGYIPERYINRRECLNIGALLAEITRVGVKLLPDTDRLSRIATDKPGGEDMVDTGRNRLCGPILSAFAPADEPSIGFHPNQIAVPFGKPCLRRIKGLVAQWNAQ